MAHAPHAARTVLHHDGARDDAMAPVRSGPAPDVDGSVPDAPPLLATELTATSD